MKETTKNESVPACLIRWYGLDPKNRYNARWAAKLKGQALLNECAFLDSYKPHLEHVASLSEAEKYLRSLLSK